MHRYGQFCPIAKASEILAERWTLLVIREIAAGSHAFNDLRKGLPLMSPSLLSSRLKSLERGGLIVRSSSQSTGVNYHLTEAGKELTPILWELGSWGHKWVRSDLSDDDLDPSMLIWDIHRTMNVEFFDPSMRYVIQFEFIDIYTRQRFWWLVIKDADVDVCIKDPGHSIDLIVSTKLKALTAVWMGDSKIKSAIRKGEINLEGERHLKSSISEWLGTNFYANVKPAQH